MAAMFGVASGSGSLLKMSTFSVGNTSLCGGEWENGLVGIPLPTNMAATIPCIETFWTLNSCNSYIYSCISLKLAEKFQNEVIYVV